MARKSRWSSPERAKLLQMVYDGVPEQDIREEFAVTEKDGGKRPMTAVEFSGQLKQAMVESGQLKQASGRGKAEIDNTYVVTSTGRLNITNFSEITGSKEGAAFKLESPRGRSKAWRLVPQD